MPVVLHLGASMDVEYRWGLGNAYCSGLHLLSGNTGVFKLFGNSLWPVSIVQESIEGFEEDPPKVSSVTAFGAHLPGRSFGLQQDPLFPFT